MLQRRIWLGFLTTLALSANAQLPTAANIDTNNSAEVLSYLQANIADDAAITSFYQKVGTWDKMRDLRKLQLPPHLWGQLADARTHLVKSIYAEVHKEMFDSHGVYFDDPKKESHFIGTPPSDPNFKGVFSDLDVGMFFDPNNDPKNQFTELSLPERQVRQIEAKRRMEKKLEAYGPDSGFLFDTNLYTSPEMFRDDEIGPEGRLELDQYDDVLAYLAIRVGCGSDEVRWLDLKQRLLNRARESEGMEPVVSKLLQDAEGTYRQFESIKANAIAEARQNGELIYPGLDEQAVTRYYEDRILAFVENHSREEVSAGDESGRALRTQYNKLKADYEASLRESYFTYAAQVYIVKWRSLDDLHKKAFLGDPNNVRRVRADQARFILHYLREPAGNEGEDLRYKMQKIAKYEQRELNILRDSGGQMRTLEGFSDSEVQDLFSQMKGKATPEDAWDVWRASNYNKLLKRDLKTTLSEEEMPKAEEYAIARSKIYLDHIDGKLVDIMTELPQARS